MAVPWMGHFMLEQRLLRKTITEAKAGDEAAFERIVILHERLVLRTAQRVLLNNEEAKDAAQDVFIRLHRNLHQLRDGEDLVPWLYRMTVNICLDAKRRSKPGVCLDSVPEAADHSLDPEQALSRAQDRALIVSALGELSNARASRDCASRSGGMHDQRGGENSRIVGSNCPVADFNRPNEDQKKCRVKAEETNMSDHAPEEQLALYLTRDLPGQELQRVAAHLENCATCQQSLGDFERSQRAMASFWPEPSGRDLAEVRQHIMRRLRRRKVSANGWILAMPAVAGVALICFFQFVRSPAPHSPVVGTRAGMAVTAEAKIPKPLPVRTVSAARIIRHRPSPAVRSIALITPVGESPLIRMNTADPNVVILLQTGEMQSDERTQSNE